MSATGHDAVNGARCALRSLDVPAAADFDAPDFTEDLAEEVTSELNAAPTPGRAAAAPAPAMAGGNAAAGGAGATGAPLLRERYRLESQIGNGGAATVHRAVDLRRDAGASGRGRHVAIKLLRPELRGRAECVARIQREFRQTQSVVHPGIVRFFDLDREGDAWFIVMELLTGETLEPHIRRAAPSGLPVEDAMRIAIAAGDALAYAHAHGVVHGDVKPGNVFLTDSGEVRLIDFGVAPDSGRRDSSARPEAPVPPAATRAYASPEVLAGQPAEPRDDVFSLACVIHRMVLGRHPHGRHGVEPGDPAAAMPEHLASLGPGRAAAVSAAMSLARAGRPSMAEFVRSLRMGGVPSAPPPVEAAAVVAPPAAVAPSATPVAGRSRHMMLGVLAAAVALVVGIAIGRIDVPGLVEPMAARAPQPAPAPRPEAAPEAALPPSVAASSPAATPQTRTVRGEEPLARRPPAGPPGLVFFDAPRMVVSRRAVVAPIPLRHLSHGRRAVSVGWRTIDGSARSGRDFVGPQSGVESFVEGNSFRILYVPIVPSAIATRDRTFTVELTGASAGAELGPTSRVEITILGES
jgi:serine/threonine protein kinase